GSALSRESAGGLGRAGAAVRAGGGVGAGDTTEKVLLFLRRQVPQSLRVQDQNPHPCKSTLSSSVQAGAARKGKRKQALRWTEMGSGGFARTEEQAGPGVEEAEDFAHHVEGIGGSAPPVLRVEGVIR